MPEKLGAVATHAYGAYTQKQNDGLELTWQLNDKTDHWVLGMTTHHCEQCETTLVPKLDWNKLDDACFMLWIVRMRNVKTGVIYNWTIQIGPSSFSE